MDHTLAVDARQTLNTNEDFAKLSSSVLKGDETLSGSDDKIEGILVSNGYLPGPKKDAAAREGQKKVAVGLVQSTIRGGNPQEAVDLMDSKEMLGRLGDQENGLRNAAQAAIEKKKSADQKKNNIGIIERVGTLAATLQEKGTPDATTRGILTAIGKEANDPEVTAAIESVLGNLPTAEEREAAIATAGIGATNVKQKQLEDAGVGEQAAALVAIGGGQVSIAANPEDLGPKEKAALRDKIANVRQAARSLEKILPQITPETVGLFAGFSENVGGVLQQLPGIRTVGNTAAGRALGLDKNTVANVKKLRKDFLASIGRISQFILNQKQRLSNQQLDMAREAVGLLEVSTSAETSQGIVRNLIDTAREVEQGLMDDLLKGKVIDTRDISEKSEEEIDADFQAILNPGQ